MRTLAIIGASGHGKVVADAAVVSGKWHRIVFYDDAWPDKESNGSADVVGDTATLLSLSVKPSVIVAIGNNETRYLKQQELVAHGFAVATVIHPMAVVSGSVVLGAGTVVMAGAVINADVSIGAACIINTNTTVEHDCVVGEAVHISPGANLSGAVKVGDRSWIGAGATIIQQIQIGKNVMVGAGAVVVKDLPDYVTAIGVPARVVRK